MQNRLWLCKNSIWKGDYLAHRGMYRKVKVLGEGTFGVVYLAERKVGGSESGTERVAIKRMFLSKGNRCHGIVSLREIEVSLIRHPFIVEVKNVSINSPFHDRLTPKKKGGYAHDKIYIAMECADANVEELMDSKDEKPSIEEAKKIMFQVGSALEYMHKRGISHRDLKTNNILVFGKEAGHRTFKLADMGAAKPLHCHSTTPEKHSTVVGYIEYRAPELLQEIEEYDEKVDVWSLGCIFYELVTGKPPFPVPRNRSVPTSVQLERITRALSAPSNLIANLELKQSIFEQTPGSLTSFKDLVFSMLVLDPKERISMKKVMEHPFFSHWTKPEIPRSPMFRKVVVSIRDCPERTDALGRLAECEIERRYYYHCIDLINRITSWTPTQAWKESAEYSEKFEKHLKDGNLICATVLGIVHKYWLTDYAPVLRDIYKFPVSTSDVSEMEFPILKHILRFRIFRPNLYELLGDSVKKGLLYRVSTSPDTNEIPLSDLACAMAAYRSEQSAAA